MILKEVLLVYLHLIILFDKFSQFDEEKVLNILLWDRTLIDQIQAEHIGGVF